jgi:hypothetical protein
MNSSDEDDPEMKPDVLEGMSTSEMDPEKGPIKLTQAQVAAQKAAAKALKASKPPPRSQAPMPTGSSDDDDPAGPQMVWSSSKQIFRRNKHWVDPNVPALLAPEPQKALPAPPVLKALPAPEPQSTPVSSDTEDQSEMTEDQKCCARMGKKLSQRSTAQRTSRSNPTTEAQASHPMATRRREASRAGGLRPGGGLEQMDTRVDLFHPS